MLLFLNFLNIIRVLFKLNRDFQVAFINEKSFHYIRNYDSLFDVINIFFISYSFCVE